MNKLLCASFFVAFSLTLNSAKSTRFDCGSLSVFECKTDFGQQFEREIFQINFDTHEAILIKYIHYYGKVLESLPEHDPHIPILREFIARLLERLHKLNMGTFDTPEGWINLQKSANDLEPDFSNLRIDDEAEKEFENILRELKPESEESSARELLHYELITKSIEVWTKLYAGLRAIDLLAYREYKYLNKDFNYLKADKNLRVKYFDYIATMRKVAKFFDIAMFKMLF